MGHLGSKCKYISFLLLAELAYKLTEKEKLRMLVLVSNALPPAFEKNFFGTLYPTTRIFRPLEYKVSEKRPFEAA